MLLGRYSFSFQELVEGNTKYSINSTLQSSSLVLARNLANFAGTPCLVFYRS